MPTDSVKAEIVNREHDMIARTPRAAVNIKAPYEGGVVAKLLCNGEEIEPVLYGLNYTESDVHISVRGLPVKSADEELEFEVVYGDYVEPEEDGATTERGGTMEEDEMHSP
jgi:hypothetical protein